MPGLRLVLRRLGRDESGAVMVYVTVALTVIFGMAALAVDFGIAYFTRDRLQITADAAALAGAVRLPSDDEALAAAVAAARQNMAVDGNGDVLKSVDVVSGNWDLDAVDKSTAFTPGATPKNALKVTTRRSAANANSLPTMFATAIGKGSIEPSASSIALGKPTNCTINGIIASRTWSTGSNGDYDGSLCIHGQMGLKIGSTNIFGEEVALSMSDNATILKGSGNKGVDEAVERRSLLAKYNETNIQSQLLDRIKNQTMDGFKTTDFVKEPLAMQPANFWAPQDGKMYMATSDITLKKTMDLKCSNAKPCAIYSTHKIAVESDSTLENIRLVTEVQIDVGSKITIGALNYCDNGNGVVFLAAKTDIKIGSDIILNGAQMFAGRDMELQSTPSSGTIAVQAGRDIIFQSSQKFRTCDRADHVVVGGDKTGRLVY